MCLNASLALPHHLSIITFTVLICTHRLKCVHRHRHYTHSHTFLTCCGEYPHPPFSSAVWAVGHHGPDTWTPRSHQLRPPGSQAVAQRPVFLEEGSTHNMGAKYTFDRGVLYVLVGCKYLGKKAMLYYFLSQVKSACQTSYQTLRTELFHSLSPRPCWLPRTHKSLHHSSWYLRWSVFLHVPDKKSMSLESISSVWIPLHCKKWITEYVTESKGHVKGRGVALGE